MSPLAQLGRQVAFTNRSFWRNPAAAFFTFAFPLMFLVIFNGIFGHPEFFAPGIAAFSVVTACYTNIAMQITIARDQGVLKRVRGTPLSPSIFMLGRVIHSALIGFLLVAIIAIFGKVFYGVDLPTATLPRFLMALTVGSLAFSAMGMAITSIIPNEDAAPAIVNATVLPLAFISDVFVPTDEIPAWLQTLSNFFPLKHFQDTLDASFPPESVFRWSDVGIVLVWGVFGLIFAVRRFRWEPRR